MFWKVLKNTYNPCSNFAPGVDGLNRRSLWVKSLCQGKVRNEANLFALSNGHSGGSFIAFRLLSTILGSTYAPEPSN